ncbi:MAG TPA: ParB N-terminal domain-containing protein [Acidimicrobiales bacterium]|nr:ParB N-terminal domain-containing protein [Acidimicrobiales bacterium]
MQETSPSPSALAARLAASARLRQRRFELLPPIGPGAPVTEPQGRKPGDTTSPEGLADLVSSISTVGVLQPILVEELPDRTRRLVAGERRLRACRIGAVDDPENPHFQAVPAVVCPGPLTLDERMVWQLVENLVRSDLQPGELAAALTYERSALLVSRLESVGHAPPAEITAIADPVERWRALDRFRVAAKLHHVGASWAEVISRLGLHLSAERAKALYHALSSLPADLSAEMDAEQISLHSRLAYLRLVRTRQDVADELWDAVRSTHRGELLYAACTESLDHELDAAAALDRAQERHDAANERRRQAARAAADGELADPSVVRAALDALGALVRELRAGRRLGDYDAGSLRLLAGEIEQLMPPDAA